MDLTNVVEALQERRTRIDRAIAALEGVGAAGPPPLSHERSGP